MIRFYSLFLIFFSITISSQKSFNKNFSTKFAHYQKLVNTTTENFELNTSQLLKYAQTPYENAYANYIIGGNLYRSSKYLEAIHYYELAEKNGNKLDSVDFKLEYTNALVMAYRRAGLIEQSNDAWQKSIELKKQSNNKYKEADYYYMLSKIYDINEDYCNAATAREKCLSLIPIEDLKIHSNHTFAIYAQEGFAQVKCGQIEEAKKSLQTANTYIQNLPNKEDGAFLYEIYQLTQALLYLKNNNVLEAESYFTSAYKTSKKVGSVGVTKLILEERLNANIDSPEEQLSISKEISEITKLETQTSKEVAQYEFKKSKKKEIHKNNQIKLWIGISILIALISIVVIILKNRRTKKLKNLYLAAKENQGRFSKEYGEGSSNEKRIKKSDVFINEDTEKELIKKLEQFENKKQFTKIGLTASQMCSILNTNSKYLAYILKTYRSSDFTCYLNNIRINYIIDELYKNPALSKYKIAALAEMAGFASHAQFTKIFKEKKGMSPSTFLRFLEEESNE